MVCSTDHRCCLSPGLRVLWHTCLGLGPTRVFGQNQRLRALLRAFAPLSVQSTYLRCFWLLLHWFFWESCGMLWTWTSPRGWCHLATVAVSRHIHCQGPCKSRSPNSSFAAGCSHTPRSGVWILCWSTVCRGTGGCTRVWISATRLHTFGARRSWQRHLSVTSLWRPAWRQGISLHLRQACKVVHLWRGWFSWGSSAPWSPSFLSKRAGWRCS